MTQSVFIECEFFALTFFSLILPVGIYAWMMWKQAISRRTVLAFGLLLIAIAGINVGLLQRLSDMARHSVSLLDDRFFVSELTIALYLFPVVFAGVGVNLITHILVRHLTEAERRYDRAARSTAPSAGGE